VNTQPAQSQMGLGWPSNEMAYPHPDVSEVEATTGLGWPVGSDGLSELGETDS